jgi:hypothetical protein
MRVIHDSDSDTVEFTDGSGDKLVLLSSPRQRDVMACDEIERAEAIAGLEGIKALGIDTDKIMADAQANPEKLSAAQAAVDSHAGPKVREFRLKILAVNLVVDGEKLGGSAIMDAYGNMDPASAAWVDEQVAEVWNAAIPSDADTRGPRADAAVPEVVSAAD